MEELAKIISKILGYDELELLRYMVFKTPYNLICKRMLSLGLTIHEGRISDSLFIDKEFTQRKIETVFFDFSNY